MTVVQLWVWLIGSVPLLWLSRTSLRYPSCHGFYRFFAFEAILALLVVNGPFWFVDRFAPLQLLSWCLLFVSLYLAIYGCWLLRRHGLPGLGRVDETLLNFEKTQRLVTCGIYRWIRHPMYASLIYLAWGLFLKQPSWVSSALTILASGCVMVAVWIEERECLDYFGEQYAEYRRRSSMFVPGLI